MKVVLDSSLFTGCFNLWNLKYHARSQLLWICHALRVSYRESILLAQPSPNHLGPGIKHEIIQVIPATWISLLRWQFSWNRGKPLWGMLTHTQSTSIMEWLLFPSTEAFATQQWIVKHWGICSFPHWSYKTAPSVESGQTLVLTFSLSISCQWDIL